MNKFQKHLVVIGIALAFLLSACGVRESAPPPPDAVATAVEATVAARNGEQDPPGPQATRQVSNGECVNHGVTAWQNDNQLNGTLYGEAPVGGLDEPCGVVAQTWTTMGQTERWTFYVPPFCVAWLSGHRGGTGWYFDPRQDARANLEGQMAQLRDRDGVMTEHIIVLPEDEGEFRLLTRMRCNENAVASATQQPAATTAATQQAGQAPPASTQVPAVSGSAGQCSNSQATGPAIVEMGVNGVPTVLRVNAGSTFLYEGGCFPFDSQAQLEGRWEGHVQEFMAKWPNGASAVAP